MLTLIVSFKQYSDENIHDNTTIFNNNKWTCL